jgi:hypothetical protein
MADLLQGVIDAHGGIERWRSVHAIDLRFNFSGAALEVKGWPRHLQPSCSIDVRAPQVIFQRLGADPDERWIFSPERCWIERRDGSLIEERHDPRDAFAGHVWRTRWDRLHLTYFIGYAIWNYISFPFLLAEPGFERRDLGEYREGPEVWRVLEVTFPDAVPAHTRVQKFYYGHDLMLRRIDYVTDLAGGVAAHYCFDHRQIDGIVFPLLRRVVSRTNEGAQVTGRTGFLLDYIDLGVRR